MSKTKNKNHDEIRYLKGVIRQLEKENRSLRKENSYYKKHAHQFEESEYENNEEEVEIEVVSNKKMCPDCARGILKEFEIMPGKVFHTCPVCDYRAKV